MAIDSIYQLIEDDLTRVEKRLESVTEVAFPFQAELLRHSLQGGGKRIRPVLTLLSGRLFDYNLESVLPMAVAVELMHTATLVHDDSIDHSDVRRGRPTINKIWGEEIAILLGDYLFARAGEFATDTGNLYVVKLFTQTLEIISSGEINQSYHAFNLAQTRQQYVDRIASKTASLFTLSTESGAILSGALPASVEVLRAYGYNLGVAFQIVDDIMDFISTEDEMGKPIGSDLAQGTLTLPGMMVLERYPEDNPVKRLFETREENENVKQAIEMVRNSSIVSDCYQVAQEYVSSACQNLEKLPDSGGRRMLAELASYVVERRK